MHHDFWYLAGVLQSCLMPGVKPGDDAVPGHIRDNPPTLTPRSI